MLGIGDMYVGLCVGVNCLYAGRGVEIFVGLCNFTALICDCREIICCCRSLIMLRSVIIALCSSCTAIPASVYPESAAVGGVISFQSRYEWAKCVLNFSHVGVVGGLMHNSLQACGKITA